MRDGQVTVIHGDLLTLYLDAPQATDMVNIYNDDLCLNPRLLVLTYDIGVTTQYRRHLLLFLLGAVLLALTAAFLLVSAYFNRRFLARVNTLNRGLQDIADGRYDTTIAIPGRDELTALADNLNRMTAAIRAREDTGPPPPDHGRPARRRHRYPGTPGHRPHGPGPGRVFSTKGKETMRWPSRGREAEKKPPAAGGMIPPDPCDGRQGGMGRRFPDDRIKRA